MNKHNKFKSNKVRLNIIVQPLNLSGEFSTGIAFSIKLIMYIIRV